MMSPDRKATSPCFATRRSGRVVTVLMIERSLFDWLRSLFARALTLLTDFVANSGP